MKSTVPYLLEPFLTQYYLLEAICGDFMSAEEKTAQFEELAQVFCISDASELQEYARDSRSEQFASIVDYPSYERLCRMIEFAENSGQKIALTERDRVILSQKREAMLIKAEMFKQGKNLTKELVSSTLLDMAMQGNVAAMATLAYMEYHGICICKDRHNAIKRIRLCAKWNQLFGNLMGLAYDSENRPLYYDTLYTVLRNANQKRIIDHIRACRGADGDCEKNAVARILEKAFGLGIIKRHFFDQVFAKIAFSSLLSVEDKEKILLSKQKEAIVSLADIPFDVKCDDTLFFEERCADALPLKREREVKRILQSIAVATNCPRNVYRPLLIVSSEPYLTEMYCKMLRDGFSGAPIIELDAATLSVQDFCAAKENVFLRGLSETKTTRTVFFIKNCEELNEEQLTELTKLFDYEYRRKFKLFQPPISLDLSDLSFVLFACERDAGAMALSEACDTVWVSHIGETEKSDVIDLLFASRSASFGCGHITMEEGCREFLCAYDTKQAQQIVDGALRSAIFEKSRQISLASMKNVCKEQNIKAERRGFGFTGGYCHA